STNYSAGRPARAPPVPDGVPRAGRPADSPDVSAGRSPERPAMPRTRTRSSHPSCPVESLESRTLFDAGTLDTAFGTNGQSNVFGFQINDVAAQPDGKTVVVGTFHN